MSNISLKKSLKTLLTQLGILTFAHGAFHALKVAIGWICFWASKKTPNFAYQSMISLFCITRGVSNDLMASLIAFFSPTYSILEPQGVLGNLTQNQITNIANEISEKGYHVFENKLSFETTQKLLDLSIRFPAKMMSIVAPNTKNLSTWQIFDPQNPLAVKYDCELKNLIEDETVQQIIGDETLLAVSQAYLKAKPILDLIVMWWSTAQKEPDSLAAQYFHFDMDRVKWLKFFFYISDVEKKNGPHEFIKGSHRSGQIPKELLKRGYARIEDEEIRPHYNSNSFIEFTGQRGTIIAEDTRGLHKGKVLEEGQRLVFQLEFTNCLFGAALTHLPEPQKMRPELLAACKKYPKTYKLFRKRMDLA